MVGFQETTKKKRFSCGCNPAVWSAGSVGMVRNYSLALAGIMVLAISWTSMQESWQLRSSLDPPLLPSSANRVLKCLPVYQDRIPKSMPIEDKRTCLLDHPASDYLQTLTKVMVGSPLGGSYHTNPRQIGQTPFPYEERLRAVGRDWPPFGYTMIGKARMQNFRNAIEEVNQNGIPGAIVELGVWRSGAMIMASALGKESGRIRDLYLFDTFAPIGTYGSKELTQYLAVPEEEVRESFRHFDLDGPFVHLEKGLFKDTLPAWKEKDIQIAVLRIDGNFYDSYQDAMYYLYEKVPVGGLVIFTTY
jgi:hypothetical protein